ncbi:DeoR/GlpR transcriptional regulator [Paenibacillus albiflavus]|uniref:DeoR/GlpR transcriptional regulator n=1 Tax=Paenibacillus albiflavus TaxID=2545760 RepID=A0A4R4EDE3_9BACL|nr:DeoR/GlpR transcriptional regulator [Paenibacillus albiflavus]
MTALKRQEKIMELLLSNGEVKVLEISELLGVTGKTIREDLAKLELQGLLMRVHGGAVRQTDKRIGSFPNRISQTEHLHQKKAVAMKAIHLIEAGDIIALDGGSSTLEIARVLPNAPLTVITNDLYIIRELVEKDQISLIVPGGYRKRNLLVSGEAVRMLGKLNIQKVFISATGLHLDYGLSIYTTELAEQKQALLEQAKYRYCVADHTKFDKYALMTFAQFTDVDRIITDDGLPDETRSRYAATGVSID